MFSKNSVKPLELVVSAIHCLGEKKGSSPQNILRFLIGKYNVDADTLRTHVQTALKRGVNFGMLTQKAGLYRLSNILSNPEFLNNIRNIRKPQRTYKHSKPVRKINLRQTVGKKGKRRLAKSVAYGLQKNKRKIKKVKDKRKKIGRTSRRVRNEARKRKEKRLKTKAKKLKPKVGKEKNVSNETEQKPEVFEGPKSETTKDAEPAKTTVKI